MGREKFTQAQVIKALRASKGMMYVAARALNCAATTIYNYASRYPAIQAVIDQERGIMVDTAELALWAAVQKQQPWAVSLVLKTIGKNRGYIERQEIAGADGGDIRIKVNWPDDPADD